MNLFFNPSSATDLGFGSFGTIQADDIAGVCSLYSCGGLGGVSLLPEPGSGLLVFTGMVMLASRRRRT